jgi:hypothetical protein
VVLRAGEADAATGAAAGAVTVVGAAAAAGAAAVVGAAGAAAGAVAEAGLGQKLYSSAEYSFISEKDIH